MALWPKDVWLVLDDYRLVDGHDVGDGMILLLEHLPPHVHVVISTRADPDLPLSRWRVRGELVEIGAAELRFSSKEAAAYLNGVVGLDLAADEVAALEQGTEGRVAALQLAALTLQGRDDVAGFIPGSPGMAGTSSITWLRRCSSTSRTRFAVSYDVVVVIEEQYTGNSDELRKSSIMPGEEAHEGPAMPGRAG
ncbi:MAG: hypothetical protein M3021_11980 [Actinomycetota bacterium]|nr:hypothetical protein [Actinomycetota bacterium]